MEFHAIIERPLTAIVDTMIIHVINGIDRTQVAVLREVLVYGNYLSCTFFALRVTP